VIVHGGGKEVTDLQRALGAEPEWREGLRVTTPEALRAVSMVLSGVVNKRLVAALITAGGEAAGISGEDGATLEAVPARGGQLGRTGEIVRVRPKLMLALLREGITPVLSPVSRGPDGGALNVNADDAASALAGALRAEKLVFVSDVEGVRGADGARIERLDGAGIADLIAGGVATGGMIPKLRSCLAAVAGGIGEVHVCRWEGPAAFARQVRGEGNTGTIIT
jgi:acetylglutamate kinase